MPQLGRETNKAKTTPQTGPSPTTAETTRKTPATETPSTRMTKTLTYKQMLAFKPEWEGFPS